MGLGSGSLGGSFLTGFESPLKALLNSLPASPRPLASSGSFLPPKRRKRTATTINSSPVPRFRIITFLMCAFYLIYWFEQVNQH